MGKEADPGDGARRERLREEQLEQLLRSERRMQAPPRLWGRVARSLSGEAVAGRRLARRRRYLVEALVGVAASVLVMLGVWRWSTPARPVPARIERTVAEPAGGAVAFDEEAETFGQVHLVYEAGNVLPEGMIVMAAGNGDEGW